MTFYFRWITILAGVMLALRVALTMIVVATGHGRVGLYILGIVVDAVLALFFLGLFARQMK